MAVVVAISYVLLLVLSAGCTEGGKTEYSISAAPNQDSAATPEKALVLHARALDRADKLDSAKILYAEAAKRVPAVAEWLYLRAAGVTTDKSERNRFLSRMTLPVTASRKDLTNAIAIERSGDIPAAIKAYESIGDHATVFRLRALRPGDASATAALRRDVIAFLSAGPEPEPTRDLIRLFDQTFKNPGPAENLTLGRAAFAVGNSARAVSGYSRAFAGGLGTPRDHFNLGVVLSRLNKDKESIAEFSRVTQPASLAAAAKYQGARGLLALGRRDAARAALRQITTAYPGDTTSASALLLLADLATDDLRDGDARSTMLSLVQRYPATRQAPHALFGAGLVAFIKQDYKAAANELDSIVSKYPSSDDALAAGYWSGRAWKARGDTAQANKRWRAVIDKERSSYYAVLSAKRLGIPLMPDKGTDHYPDVPEVDAATRRIVILRDFGMDTEANFEYDWMFKDADQSPDRLVATAHALAGSDQSARAITLGRQAVAKVGPTPQNYRLMYPVLERPTLTESAKKYNLDPALVASLIKQESAFNPRATSPVGARGLMQLMPPVGRGLAKAQNIAGYTDESLYDPAINIRLGTQHLAALFNKTSNIERVLAAYNAGESRVTRWAQKAGAADPELFTERIPFVETRDYVRSIVRNRAFYSALYSW